VYSSSSRRLHRCNGSVMRPKAIRVFPGKKESVQRSGEDSSNTVNMSVVQNPTPPGLDLKKFKKLAGMVLAGCIGMGLGLAFALELFPRPQHQAICGC